MCTFGKSICISCYLTAVCKKRVFPFLKSFLLRRAITVCGKTCQNGGVKIRMSNDECRNRRNPCACLRPIWTARGKRSTPPLFNSSIRLAGHAKALSPLRSASAVHNTLEPWPIRPFRHTHLFAPVTKTTRLRLTTARQGRISISTINHNQPQLH